MTQTLHWLLVSPWSDKNFWYYPVSFLYSDLRNFTQELLIFEAFFFLGMLFNLAQVYFCLPVVFPVQTLCFTCSLNHCRKFCFVFYFVCQSVFFMHCCLFQSSACCKELCNLYFAIQINLMIIICLSLSVCVWLDCLSVLPPHPPPHPNPGSPWLSHSIKMTRKTCESTT